MKLLNNPVLAKELRTRIRGVRAPIIVSVYLGLIGLITLLVYAVAAPDAMQFNRPNAGSDIGQAIFFTVMIAALVQVCVITPSLTAGSIAGEKERQSYDLLITTMLSPWEIILGKMVSALAFAMMLILASLPLAGLSFLFGGVSVSELVIGMFGLIVTAIFYASIGMFWSSVMRGTLGSTVAAQGTVIIKLLIIPFLFFILSLLFDAFDGQPTAFYVYTMGTFMSAHPFIALGMSDAMIKSGEGLFSATIPVLEGDIWVPSPWLVYFMIAFICSAVLLSISARMLRPVQYTLAKKKTKAE